MIKLKDLLTEGKISIQWFPESDSIEPNGVSTLSLCTDLVTKVVSSIIGSLFNLLPIQ